jgi:hypothetical protein
MAGSGASLAMHEAPRRVTTRVLGVFYCAAIRKLRKRATNEKRQCRRAPSV